VVVLSQEKASDHEVVKGVFSVAQGAEFKLKVVKSIKRGVWSLAMGRLLGFIAN